MMNPGYPSQYHDRINNFRKWRDLALALILSSGLVGCLGSTSSPGQGANRDETGNKPQSSLNTLPRSVDLPLFETHMHGLLVNNCNRCHTSSGLGKGAMADSDVDQAYDETKSSRIDLSDTANSKLVSHTRSHMAYCGSDTDKCRRMADDLRSGLDDWAAAAQAHLDSTSRGQPNSTVVRSSAPASMSTPVVGGTVPQAMDEQFFAQTLHPVLADPGISGLVCATCHLSPTAMNVPPTASFAAYDLAAAYAGTRGRVSFAAPMSSLLVTKLAQGHFCVLGESCDTGSAAIASQIAAWAQLREDYIASDQGGPKPLTEIGRLASAGMRLADGVIGERGRVKDAVIAKWEFNEGAGNVIRDTSGVGPPLDLAISDMEWAHDGLKSFAGKAQGTQAGSAKILNMITGAAGSGQFTLEAWLTPDQVDSNGRIASLDRGGFSMRYADGAEGRYHFESAEQYSLLSDPGVPQAEQRVHLVMTYDAANGKRIYADGQLVATDQAAQTLTLLSDQVFILGRLPADGAMDQAYHGKFHFFAIHRRSLTAAEIAQNYAAGFEKPLILRFDISQVAGIEGSYIQLNGVDFDEQSYLLHSPRITVPQARGLRVAGLRIGVNGEVADLGQSFANTDVMLNTANQLISSLGAVIPKQHGADQDIIHVEFEIFGDKANPQIEAN